MTGDAFGIYVHWPYCAAKCPYCDFNSHVRESFSETKWAEGVLAELRAVASLQGETRAPVSSIFFGGGTPSLMSGLAVGTVLAGIAALWQIDADAEITLEANPNSVERVRFRDYRAAGVNRISIGVQSFDDASLKALGRLHGADEARLAIRTAQEIFPRVSFDLIYTRPGQSLEAWESELGEALSFGTEHLSLYQLTIENGTAYAGLARQGLLVLPGEEPAAAFYERTQALCEAAGLHAYEVSNHARAGAESRHNLLYWRYGDYAGVGPGAHGRLTLAGSRVATLTERLPERWMAGLAADGPAFHAETVDVADAAREHLLMNLRLSEGLDLAAYGARWGTAPTDEKIADLAEDGIVTVENGRLKATPRGRLVLNAAIAALLD